MDKAEKSLMKLRTSEKEGVQKELEEIKQHLKREEEGSLLDILRRSELRKAFIICLVLIIGQEMSGFCAITFYLQPIFIAAGTELPSEISALIVGVALLASSFIAPFIVDRLVALLGAFFYVLDSTDLSTDPIVWLPIFSLIFFIVSFNLGMGSIPWTLCSELFPNNVKQIAASAQSSTCWVTTFLVTFFFNDMNEGMGRAGTFWFFAGKSFSEIQDMLKFGKKRKVSSNGNPDRRNEIKIWTADNK
ncbi:hypothetical protein NQ317_003806 [Molorchus minor]|uniref:Major facilitator superfamily (MFS) profile domain-containing protein n=1 Tax=Molorchus minor TaxID=1323400 RepID=A0ABQ9JH51_9CUCU|nr:hypothetical protein NQ317_003806 [Molorchus minor]